jgi:hypothetical protein
MILIPNTLKVSIKGNNNIPKPSAGVDWSAAKLLAVWSHINELVSPVLHSPHLSASSLYHP